MRKAGNKLIHFAKRAERGSGNAMNLLKGRVSTKQVLKKLLVETVPKLDHIPQNYVKIEKGRRHRRGDNAPMVFVTVRGSEKEEVVQMQLREVRERSREMDRKEYNRRVLSEEKVYYEKLMEERPEMEEFFRRKLAKVEFDLWTLDKGRLEKRINLLA